MSNHLYICSSVRHLYLTLGYAMAHPLHAHHVVMLEQDSEEKRNPLVKQLQLNPGPLTSFNLPPPQTASRSRYKKRKLASRYIAERAIDLNPQKIFGGNDRRVEFQYTMYRLRKENLPVKGVYLDDGSASYVNGRYLKFFKSITDLTIDHLLKKLFWGVWYHKSLYYGGTRWVDECLLNFPDLAPEYLKKNKYIECLQANWYRQSEFQRYMSELMAKSHLLKQEEGDFLDEYDALLILPLAKFVVSNYGGIERYLAVIDTYLKANDCKRIAIKYHPRESHKYFQSNFPLAEIPAALPAEIIFSLIRTRSIVGDLSSALLSAVWLLPNAHVICLCLPAMQSNPIMKLVKKTSVEMVMLSDA